MEDHWLRSAEDEREDIRTLPRCLRRLLRTQGRILQNAQGYLLREHREKEGTCGEGAGTRRQHRLEGNKRQTHRAAEGVEDHWHGSEKARRPALAGLPRRMQQVLRGSQRSRRWSAQRGARQPREEAGHHRAAESTRRERCRSYTREGAGTHRGVQQGGTRAVQGEG